MNALFFPSIFKPVNLVIDIGNTRIKAAVFKENIPAGIYSFNTVDELSAAAGSFGHISNCIIASVTSQHEQAIQFFSGKCNTMLFTADTPGPLKNKYRSALTLGSDRLAASTGAYTLYPNQDVLTIDAGTCIKYNFVNAANEFLGGAISPGINMRLKAMNHYTRRLPLIEAEPGFDQLIGETTAGSILSGALNGAACEAEGMSGRYRVLYPGLRVVVTGGDATYLCGRLKNRFFAHQNLLLSGLNTILNFNLEK